MAQLGPFAPMPRLAAGVSGGADSLALAILADGWVRARGGSLLALIVDHGLRPAAAGEAQITATRLAARGIATRILTLHDLPHGPLAPGSGLAARARIARLGILTTACAGAGITDLLLGHHAADQAETVLIRALSASGPAGLAGMAGLRVLPNLRLLRPLLQLPPAILRDCLRAAGLGWVEDPSNTNPAALRARLRSLRADHAGTGAATWALHTAAHAAGQARARTETATADWLAAHVSLRPEGFAILPPGPFPPDALASLIRAIAGAAFPPPSHAIAALAAQPRPTTLAGTRLLPAGRLGAGQLGTGGLGTGGLRTDQLGAGWLLVREAAAMAPPIPAHHGAIWDNRFRLGAELGAAYTLGALGADAARLRHRSALPAAVLVSLPAIRQGAAVCAVPHLSDPDTACWRSVPVLPAMLHPAATPPFVSPSIAFGYRKSADSHYVHRMR